MKVLLETSQPVTNLELFTVVSEELRQLESADEARKTKDEIRYQTNLLHLAQYCEESRVTGWPSEADCASCMSVLSAGFDLRQFDLLQIANMVPISMPELLQAIESPELRFDENQLSEMLATIQQFVQTTEAVMD
eukprot:Protomagalhaensia_sp_Gyna_25__1921@NODE_201_length_4440_cov_35_914338_g155_i0_p4_GENE_NODE_201_length_4440_cov_35_914338_g155_i0NODE_201_length_4440_cov_35_914338_g155_i0_p4_ORF_typecomplete_len135_score25_68RNA_pol_Rpb4/PF03874_16/4e11EFhand_14/PF17959_1/3_5e03EFhand_14/PF17959_1/0_15_NODE_201_length_4440_cov_35_914338_g155_i08831287